MPNKKSSKIAIHIFLVSMILLLPIIDAPTPNPRKMLWLLNPYLPIDFVLHCLCVLFGYLNYFYLVPRLYFKRFKFQYGFSIFLFFLLLNFTPMVLLSDFLEDYISLSENIYIHQIVQMRHVFFLFVIVFLFSLMFRLEKNRQNIEQEANAAEMRFLKAQINPHFFFNALNTIYSQLQFDPKKASDSLLKMSGIMRYAMSSAKENSEKLSDTIAYLKNYIDLQKQRFDSTIIVNSYCDIANAEHYRIAPLVLIPFVENAFKYGISTQGFSHIVIDLKMKHNTLVLYVENKDYSHFKNELVSNSVGIANTVKRLQIMYPNQHRLTYGSENGIYKVHLEIKLETAQ